MIFDVDQGPKTMDLIKYLLHSRGASIVMAYPAKGNSQRQILFQQAIFCFQESVAEDRKPHLDARRTEE